MISCTAELGFHLVTNKSFLKIFASSSHPYVTVTLSSLIPANTKIPEARPIVGRVGMVIPGDKMERIESVLYSNNLKEWPQCLSASSIHSHVNEKGVHWMVIAYGITEEVTMVVPRINGIVLNPPLGYFIVYTDHFKAGLCFPLISLLVELLLRYDITLS